MPIVTIQITKEGTTPDQKAALIRGVTAVLTDVLLKTYPDDHEVVVYEAARFAACAPKIERVALRDLPKAGVTSPPASVAAAAPSRNRRRVSASKAILLLPCALIEPGRRRGWRGAAGALVPLATALKRTAEGRCRKPRANPQGGVCGWGG